MRFTSVLTGDSPEVMSISYFTVFFISAAVILALAVTALAVTKNLRTYLVISSICGTALISPLVCLCVWMFSPDASQPHTEGDVLISEASSRGVTLTDQDATNIWSTMIQSSDPRIASRDVTGTTDGRPVHCVAYGASEITDAPRTDDKQVTVTVFCPELPR